MKGESFDAASRRIAKERERQGKLESGETWDQYLERVAKEDRRTDLRREAYYRKKGKARAKRKRTGR